MTETFQERRVGRLATGLMAFTVLSSSFLASENSTAAQDESLTPSLQPTAGETLNPEKVDPFCVSSHLNYLSPEEVNRQLDLMKEAGIKRTRFDFEWGVLNPHEDEWNFDRFDGIVSKAKDRGIDIIALLPQWAAPEWKRAEEDYRKLIKTPDDYAQYAGKVAEHFKGEISLYELGNEPDSIGYDTSMDIETYSKYLIAASASIKAADPEAKIISAGITSEHDPRVWLQGLYENNAGDSFDLFGYHPYSQPEGPSALGFTVTKDIDSNMIAHGNNNGVIASEIGWPTGTTGESVSEDVQAQYVGEVYKDIIDGDFPFVPIACIYDLVDDGADPSVSEDNFGLLRADYSQKPSYLAIQEESSDFENRFTSVNP